MLRLLFVIAILLFVAAVAVAIIRSIRASKPDWAGIAFAVGFVALAYYLGQITGMSLL